MNRIEFPHNLGKILKSVSYFSALDSADLDLLAQSAIRLAYEARQVILSEGEPCAGLYIVESGWLKAVKIGTDGREQILQMLRAGEAFNAISVFTDAPNQASVSALETSVIWIIPRQTLPKLMDEYPALALRPGTHNRLPNRRMSAASI
jgi:CRP/FNR family transcriptional regulator